MLKRALMGVMTLAVTLSVQAEEWLETTGDVLAVALPVTAVTATYSLDDPEGRRGLLWSLTLNQAATYALKYGVRRERPDGSNDLSFPSGHTSLAFGGASFLQRRYGWDAGLPAYLAASLVGYSRIETDKHYVSDVLAGAALTVGFNALLVDKSSRQQFTLLPQPQGLALAYRIEF